MRLHSKKFSIAIEIQKSKSGGVCVCVFDGSHHDANEVASTFRTSSCQNATAETSPSAPARSLTVWMSMHWVWSTEA
jgi:uncharacterized protein (DUF2141 family)